MYLNFASGRRGDEKIVDPHRDSDSDPSVVQPVASRYNDYAIAAPVCNHGKEIKNWALETRDMFAGAFIFDTFLITSCKNMLIVLTVSVCSTIRL